MRTFNEFINEKISNDLYDIIDFIEKSLAKEFDEDSFADFVDHQKLRDCQEITEFIMTLKISNIKHVIGEIKVDNPYYDSESNKYSYKMVHHWILFNNIVLDFSKGTLKDFIDFIFSF